MKKMIKNLIFCFEISLDFCFSFLRCFKILLTPILISFFVFPLNSCTFKKAELGSASNPIKLFFVPSVDAKLIADSSKVFKTFIENNTPYKIEIVIPQSYVAVVEAFGTKRADVAAINTFGYILANEKYGAEARLTFIRNGFSTYQSMFVAKESSSIKTLNDLKGKKIAFVDASSTSGYLLPLKVLKDRKIEPAQTVFAQKHDNVISMVYQGQVDAGAAFYSPPLADGTLTDARRLVLTQYPDIGQKVKIVELTDHIPNDPIIFRKDLPENMKTALVEAFIKFVGTEEGKKAFEKIYGVTDLKKATDNDYNAVRDFLKTLGKSANELLKK